METPAESAAPVSTIPGAIDQSGLISTILRHQDLDSLLRLSVVLCDRELQGDGCSLFLYDAERGEIVLKESTVLTRFLGQRHPFDVVADQARVDRLRELCRLQGLRPETLDHTLTEDQTEHWSPELVQALLRFGLTGWAYWFRCPLLVDRVREDLRWSSFTPREARNRDLGIGGAAAERPHSAKKLGHCELSDSELGSIVVVPIGGGLGEPPKAVLRVVRRGRREGFAERALQWITWFADLLHSCMTVAISLSDLTDLGTRLEVEDFGRTLVDLLHRVLRAEGCSIFLEMEPPPPDETRRRRTFQCIATTGLVSDGVPIDKADAKYEVDMSRRESEYLTSWVVQHGQLIALPDVHSFNERDFPGLLRQVGRGKFSETDASGRKFEPGPILISPLFLHQAREVAGAIRVVRRRGEVFQVHEQLRFLDISRRLSRVLTNLHLRQVSEKLIKLYNDPDAMLKRVPQEVSRLLGVEGCSVFLTKPGKRLVLAGTSGALAGQEGKLEYNYDDPRERGWTGWVAHTKVPLRLNAPEEAATFFPSDPPRHGEDEKRPCEIGEPAFRFLAVPILRDSDNPAAEVLGVIRAPRRREDPKFEEVHESILVSFAARLSLALSLSRRNEQLKAVAELSHSEEALGDPKAVAGRLVERAVEVLTDQLGFESAALFTLDTRTGEIRLRHHRSSDPGFELQLRTARSADGGDVHALAIRTRNDVSVEGWDLAAGAGPTAAGPKRFVCPILLGPIALGTVEAASPVSGRLSGRQKDLVRLLAGSCANALYNEAVFCKLDDIRQGLVQVGREMTVDSPLRKKLEVIAWAAARVTLADNVIIHEYLGPPPEGGDSRGHFRESACGGLRPPKRWQEIDFRRPAVPFRIVERQEPLFAEVAEQSDVIFHRKEGENFIQREEIRSVAALPLRVEGTCVGCIFFNFARRQEFDAQKRQEIQMMAEYAAIAIYQGRLLEETQKLTREKSNLLQYAQHSLNQPLNALLSYLSNLAGGVYRDRLQPDQLLDPEQFRRSRFARDAEQYHQLCQYMRYLIKTFLRIDRLEAERREGEPAEEDLFKIEPTAGRDLSAVCRRAASVAEAYLMGTIDQQIAPDVVGRFDQDAIQIALLNLLVNSVKHGRPATGHRHGTIRLTLSAFEREDGRWAEILVEDTGPGVPEEERQLIFQKDYSKGGHPAGLGIGLYLTHGYVKAHRGAVSVDRSVDLGGARFNVRLPLAGGGGNAGAS